MAHERLEVVAGQGISSFRDRTDANRGTGQVTSQEAVFNVAAKR